MKQIKPEKITYHPDKRPFYEKSAPAGEHYACVRCNKWIKVEEWEEHKKLHNA